MKHLCAWAMIVGTVSQYQDCKRPRLLLLPLQIVEAVPICSPALWNMALVSGEEVMFTPPTAAEVQVPYEMAEKAEWVATRAEEQAVSTVTAGPRRPKVYDKRPEVTDREAPAKLSIKELRHN